MGKIYNNANLKDAAGNQLKYARISRCILDHVSKKGEVYLSFYKDYDARKANVDGRTVYTPAAEVRLGVDENEGINPITQAVSCLKYDDFVGDDGKTDFGVAQVYALLETKKIQVNYCILQFSEGENN